MVPVCHRGPDIQEPVMDAAPTADAVRGRVPAPAAAEAVETGGPLAREDIPVEGEPAKGSTIR